MILWWALGWLLVGALMALLWARQRVTRNAATVDVAWAAGLGLIAILYALAVEADPARRALVAVMAGAWSSRLAFHLYRDRIRGRPEEGRYRSLRERWGERADRNLFFFFQAQALLDAVLSLSFLAALASPRGGLDAWDLAGGLLWILSLSGESLADAQLARFRNDPANRGRTCRAGLWRYSRHPNYFFEWLHWWSYVLVGAFAPLTLLAPAIMLFLILKVTGIPPTEAQALASRGDDYRDYQRTTNAFFPWFPRKARG